MTPSPQEVWLRALCAAAQSPRELIILATGTLAKPVEFADAALKAYQKRWPEKDVEAQKTEIKWDENAEAFVDRKVGECTMGCADVPETLEHNKMRILEEVMRAHAAQVTAEVKSKEARAEQKKNAESEPRKRCFCEKCGQEKI